MVVSEPPGAHHGGHGGGTAPVASALPVCFPRTWPGGEGVPEPPCGVECAREHPGPWVCAESCGVDN
eukprot:12750318-Heterocapsa_arctica.AAC.1